MVLTINMKRLYVVMKHHRNVISIIILFILYINIYIYMHMNLKFKH